jgi:hypothetical protein
MTPPFGRRLTALDRNVHLACQWLTRRRDVRCNVAISAPVAKHHDVAHPSRRR